MLQLLPVTTTDLKALLIGEAWCHAAADENSRGTRSAKKRGVKGSRAENEEVGTE